MFVATYRLYCLDEREEIIASHWIRAATDQDAIELVKKEHPASKCELWFEKRLVASFET
jgi:hypothetical protein